MEPSEVRPMQYVSVNGGLLVQELDIETRALTADMCVTKKRPSPKQMADLEFGWRIVKHVKSNALAAVKNGCTVGVGAGQMNRVGSAEIALKQARAAGATEDRAGVGRFLPLRRYGRARRAVRRCGYRSARRFGPRRGFNPQGRRTWDRHVVHGRTSFQTLIAV